MNKTEMMYKLDTGMNSKIGIEIERSQKIEGCIMMLESEIEAHFDLEEDIIELPTTEYLRWLEEKVEQLSPKQ